MKENQDIKSVEADKTKKDEEESFRRWKEIPPGSDLLCSGEHEKQ